MDFDETITKLHGALSSFEEDTPVLRKQHTLKQIFDKATDVDKSRMIFFMLLNSNTAVQDELMNNDDIGLLTGICPSLSVEELASLLLTLKLTGHISAIITSCPFIMIVEVIDVLLKDFSADDALSGICDLTVGIFEKINKADITESSYVLPYFNKFIDKLWTLFDSDNFSVLMDCVFKMYVNCLRIFNIKECDYRYNPVFRFEWGELKMGDSAVQCTGSEWLVPFLEDFKTKFSSLCSSYHDKPEMGMDVLKSHSASETAYLLYLEICKTGIETSLLDVLNCFMKRPEPECVDIGTIIRKIRNGRAGDSKSLFKALVNFSNALESEEAVHCIKENLNLGDEEDMRFVYDTLKVMIEKNHTDQLQELMISCLESMTLEGQLRCLNEYFGERHRFMLEPDRFDERLMEEFNKLSEVDGNAKTLLISFCIQSPLKTISKICRLGLSSPTQASATLDYLKMLKSACVSVDGEDGLNNLNTVLNSLFESGDLTDKEKQCLSNLIARLQKENLLGVEFAEICLLGNIRKEVDNVNWGKAVFLLDVLKSLVKLKTFHCKEAALLAFLSQLLDHSTWDYCSFSTELADAREIVITIITWMMRKKKVNSEAEVSWLRQKISSCCEVNRFYFCELWHSWNLDFPANKDLYKQLLLLLNAHTNEQSIIDSIILELPSRKLHDLRISLINALIKVLPVLIRQEWTKLFMCVVSIMTSWSKLEESRSVLNAKAEVYIIFATCLHCLAQNMNRRKETSPCFEFCLRNFGRTIHQIFLTGEKIEPGMCVKILKGLLFVLHGVRCPESRRSNALALSPLVFSLKEAGRKSEGTIDEIEELEEWFKNDFI
ncbi:UNVERIFIED_CONTAM: hypothetical protein PYX00_001330 [Menopon gallinae]|uniref:Uncharacterized protein n=1 Tax=Menopon gallinae TaxID=328185 RepID=A0AAW2ICF0_9NEOP